LAAEYGSRHRLGLPAYLEARPERRALFLHSARAVDLAGDPLHTPLVRQKSSQCRVEHISDPEKGEKRSNRTTAGHKVVSVVLLLVKMVTIVYSCVMLVLRLCFVPLRP
jgi:hypothetical protein